MADPREVIPCRPVGPIELIRPNVSIVIPTYNHLNQLRECVDSIIDYTDLLACEVVIVANGCIDGTVEYLKTLPPPFRHIVDPKPLGFTAATNRGIEISKGDYVVLLNNDTVLIRQPKNLWIDLLLAPFRRDEIRPGNQKTGITGPCKFYWTVGETKRRAIAFWCAMIPKKLFSELGLLDEIFSPGMGEDGDFSIKAELAGYSLVAVPEDQSEEFGKGIPSQKFPIFHHGSATFSDEACISKKEYAAVEKRNAQILRDRYGRNDQLEETYREAMAHPCDVNQLFPTLRKYASECAHVTEFGVRGVMTTWAFLAARPKRMVSYDIEYEPFAGNIAGARKEAQLAGIRFDFRHQDVLQADIEPTELLFIDTLHTYAQLKAELARHAGKVSKYILIHDTESFGRTGADGGPGEIQAIDEFLREHPEWKVKEVLHISNGLTILERGNMFCSIVIPTCGKKWESVLKVCMEPLLQCTDLSNKEIIVVANGAPKEAIEYLRTKPVKIMEFPEPLGYIRAVNAGIKAAAGEYVVLLDDDSWLHYQELDLWIGILHKPFLEDPKMGATGPFGQTYPDLGQVLHSGCTMYKTAVLREINYFDEAFNPGYMGDEDLALRIREAGYHLEEVPKGGKKEYVNGMFHIAFPVVHTGEVSTMPKYTTDLPLVKKNRDLLLERHGPGGTYVQVPGRGFIAPNGSSGYCGVSGFRGDELVSKPELDRKMTGPKVSIVIPTFNHLEDLLKPNIQSLVEFTDLSDLEVIIVANGCTDGTEDHVKSLGPPFKVLSFPDALGFTKATNEGLKVAQGEYIILFNNDNQLLSQPKHRWVNQLLEPFKDNPTMGITGPLQLHDDYADQDVIIGFCLCIKRSVMQECMADTGGLLDEVFSPGGGEDIDLCCKVRAKGYAVRQVPNEGKLGFSHTNEGDFMIWHKNNQTFKDIPEYTRWYVKRNGWINMKRYNKSIRLNLGSGGMEYPGYLSVDLHDRRAVIIQDITKLDFDDDSVTEMIAIHVLEHLSPYVVLDTLKLWFRLLKPGGKLTMELPDLESLCKRYLEANTGKRYGIANCIYGSVNTTGDGEPSDITSPHLFGWDQQQIFDHLMNAGFRGIVFGPEKYPHPEPPNMHVDAFKPLKPEA